MEAPKPADPQPPAFYLLLLLQAGERFAYYGSRTFLALYLMQHLGLETATVGQVFALFTGAAMIAPLLGGYLADRVLGPRQVLLAGLALSAAGALLLGLSASPFIALGLLAVGTGVARPPLLVLLGQLYRQGDPRRDSGFTWLYVALNAAALVAPAVFGVLATGGMQTGMLAAGIIMLAVLGCAAASQRLLPADGYTAGEEAAPRARLSQRNAVEAALCALALAALVVVAIPLGAALSPVVSPGTLLLGAAAALLVIGIGVEHARASARRDAPRPLGTVAWQRLMVLTLLGLLTLPAWMAEDLRSRLTGMALRSTRDVAWLLGLNTLSVILAGALLAVAWRRLDGSGRAVSGIAKMGSALLVIGAGAAALLAARDGEGAPVVPALAMSGLLMALGEVCLVPIGQAMVTKLAPPRAVALSMGAWMTLAALGTVLLPMLTVSAGEPGSVLLGGVAATICAAGALLFVFGAGLRRWMHGAEDPAPARPAGGYRDAGVSETEPAAEVEPEAGAVRQMVFGALWALGGLAVTLASLAAAEGGGRYVVAYGAIIYGVVSFLRGLARWGGGRQA